MKKIVGVCSIVFLVLFCDGVEAQILKKLQRKVEDKLAQKAADKAQEETEKSLDTILNADAMAMAYGKNKVDAALVPNSYAFSWQYSLEIQSGSEKAMIVDYFLEPSAEYFGFKMRDSQEMFMLIDNKNKLIITTFKQESKKVAIASKIPDYSDKTEKENEKETEAFSYKTLPNKIIRGYNCKGIQATSKDFTMVFYYTNEAEVSLSDLFSAQQKQKNPAVLQSYFKPGDKPLMMTASMKDLKNQGQITTMTCISLDKKASSFVKSDYTFL